MGLEWYWFTLRSVILKEIIKAWKKYDFRFVYNNLRVMNYNYTLDNLEHDFSKINSTLKYCYLIYLLSNECTVKNTLLICDFLIYTDTFFYDVHPVIRMLINQAYQLFPKEKTLLEWVVINYENHPDSPFSLEELDKFKTQCTGDGSVMECTGDGSLCSSADD